MQANRLNSSVWQQHLFEGLLLRFLLLWHLDHHNIVFLEAQIGLLNVPNLPDHHQRPDNQCLTNHELRHHQRPPDRKTPTRRNREFAPQRYFGREAGQHKGRVAPGQQNNPAEQQTDKRQGRPVGPERQIQVYPVVEEWQQNRDQKQG